MARTALTVNDVVRSGLAWAPSAANVDGHSILNNGHVVLYVKNGGGAGINVTIQTPGTVDGNAISDLVVAVAAAGEKILGPFPPDIYNQSTGDLYVDFSGVTTVTVFAVRI